MSAHLDHLATLLATNGVGVLATTLFKGKIPLDIPGVTPQDACWALRDVPGLPALRTHQGRTVAIEQPMVQFLARGVPHDYLDADTRIWAAYNVVNGLTNVVLSGVFYLWLEALHPPFPLRDPDEMGRTVMSFTLRVAKSMS